jgi:hypothetical protein
MVFAAVNADLIIIYFYILDIAYADFLIRQMTANNVISRVPLAAEAENEQTVPGKKVYQISENNNRPVSDELKEKRRKHCPLRCALKWIKNRTTR